MQHGPDRSADIGRLGTGLALVVGFMVAEVVCGLAAHSLALLSDAAHMLTDAAALALSLLAARLTLRPARGAMTFGLGRAEILSAQANGLTMLLLGGLILYGGVEHLLHPPKVEAGVVLIVALVGVVVNLVVVRVLGGHGHGHGHVGHDHGGAHPGHDHGPARSLNMEGSLAHLATDLFGFAATAAAAGVILLAGWRRADAVASLLIAAVMVVGGWPLLRAAVRVMMEAAPSGLDPEGIGRAMAVHPGVAEVHDLHVWEVTSGFPALSAHVVVVAGVDCHEIRHELAELLADRYGVSHTTLQVEHAQAPLQIEVSHRV